jgi:CheY-like chemotaxis protein
LIELSGGTLSINTKGRDGSKFAATISLPVKNMIKVMVVDDNRDTLQFIARCLTGTRYLLIPVNEPEKAVEIASANQPQVIILDVMLPRIDGWELLGRFQHHPVLKEIPVVVFSILPQDQMAKDLGAMAFLKKPVSRDNLLAFLDQNLNHFLEQ